jgi:LemA protein
VGLEVVAPEVGVPLEVGKIIKRRKYMKNNIKKILLILIVVVVITLAWFFSIYNKLQVMDEQISANWAQVENQLVRRSDLIPNLVNTVKGYAKHEEGVYTKIAEARSKLAGSVGHSDVDAVSKSASELNSALSRLLVVVERYPELKADKTFIMFQDELTGTENRIAVARRDYNESIKTLNSIIRTFPTSIVASYAKIEKKEYFEIEENKKDVPKVNF